MIGSGYLFNFISFDFDFVQAVRAVCLREPICAIAIAVAYPAPELALFFSLRF
ncbi:hypothetical protein BSIN_0149 [Burkholderia singularis]|uniref:Uncharacterized protein n=1 Tax=Burkholderia singularis TaxID=1503053 RepID=A0A238H2B9_9BURK|nr:hypothetical protein BSIN_0149 [Burkholderia singularis]